MLDLYNMKNHRIVGTRRLIIVKDRLLLRRRRPEIPGAVAVSIGSRIIR